MIKLTTCLILSLLIVTVSISQVQRIDGQTISGNVNWQGTIIISGDVIVEQKSRLVIEPGTKVLFEPNIDITKGGTDKTRSEVIVRGTLIARGLPGRKIVFSSYSDSPRMGDWYSLQFLHLKSGTLMEYCVIEYAHNGLTIKNSQILINNCEVRYNYHAGIRTEVKSNPEIKNSIVSENGYAGIICELGSKPFLTDNLISLNRIGVVIFSLSQPNLGNKTPGEDYNPGRNNIYNNEEFNLYNHSNKKIIAENNFWGDNNRSTIAQKVYDNDDNSKYGSVDFVPMLRQSGQQNLGTMLLLAQNAGPTSNPPPPSQAQTQPVTQSAPSNANESTPVNADTISNSTEDQRLAVTRENEIIDETMDLSMKLDEMSPLMASAAAPEPVVHQLAVNSKEVKKKIDYNKTFLELFLDGGKKKYLKKPDIVTSEIPSDFWKKGEVRVKVIVDKNGQVESASVLRGLNEYVDQVVLETVNNYEYQIGLINGRAVKFSTSEVFRFK
jgi:TonB family protein